MEIPSGKGGFVTIRDILDEGIANIRSSASFADELDVKEKERIEDFLQKMERVIVHDLGVLWPCF